MDLPTSFTAEPEATAIVLDVAFGSSVNEQKEIRL
jgi:hypothetical protein